jgi:hypothetical protein
MPAARLGAGAVRAHSLDIDPIPSRTSTGACVNDVPKEGRAMIIRRGTLYAGMFLLAAGGVTLAVATNVFDRTMLANAAGILWPVAIIAVGAGLALRRSPAALAAGIAAAALPGLALGAAMVAVPDHASWCTNRHDVAITRQVREGTFAETATVDIQLPCGELDVTTRDGTGWSVDTSDGPGRRTEITGDASRLSVTAHGTPYQYRLDAGLSDWDVVLPTAARLDLVTRVDAGRGRLDLDGARLGLVDLVVNAGELRTDLAGASLDRLHVAVNAGEAIIALPIDDFVGDITANAGELQVCVPDDLGLRVRATAALGSVRTPGLVRVGDAWETPGYATAPIRAELTTQASVGLVTISTQGGCQ